MTLFLFATPAIQAGDNSQQLQAIARMGELNGVALQCSYLEQVQRIKQALILNLPKQREFGIWFEKTTQDSFMNFMQNSLTCPDVNDLDQQIYSAISQLKSEFKK